MSLGYYPKNTTRVVFDYLYYPIQGTGGFFSTLLGATQANYRFSSYNQGNCYVLCYNNQQEYPSGWTADGAVEFGNFYLKVNGNTVYTRTATGAFTSNVALTLGADKPTGGDELYDPNTKIGRFCIYEDNTLIAEFLPALDANNVAGLYNATNDTFLYSARSPWAAGPLASSISASASKKVLAAAGETINIEVSCDNAWEVSGNTWLTLSSTGDTSGTTITATAPSYSGVTNRADTLTFTDTVTGDEVEIIIRQKKYSLGQPMYLGSDEISEMYLGVNDISEAYLGLNLVFSTGPFQGLKVRPSSLSFNPNSLTNSISIKSSESWSMTVPSWISASVLTGDTGETIVSLTATTQTADTTDSIIITSANYSASAECTYANVQYLTSIQTDGACWFDTGIIPDIDTRIEMVITPLANSGNWNGFIGAQNNDDDNTTFQIRRNSSNNRWSVRVGNGKSQDNGPSYSTNQRYTLALDRNNFTVNGTAYSVGTSSMDTAANSLYIGAIHCNGFANDNYRASAAIFEEIKVYKNNVLVGDFKPATYNSAPCFFDEVTGLYKENLGTGTPIGV